jgi:hypothetical protein
MPNPTANYQLDTITLAASPATQSDWIPLGNPTELGLYVPALSPSSPLTVKVAQDAAGTGAAILVDGTGTQKLVYASGAGGFAISSNEMGACLGYSHISILCGTAQTTQKLFKLARKVAGTDPSV